MQVFRPRRDRRRCPVEGRLGDGLGRHAREERRPWQDPSEPVKVDPRPRAGPRVGQQDLDGHDEIHQGPHAEVISD